MVFLFVLYRSENTLPSQILLPIVTAPMKAKAKVIGANNKEDSSTRSGCSSQYWYVEEGHNAITSPPTSATASVTREGLIMADFLSSQDFFHLSTNSELM